MAAIRFRSRFLHATFFDHTVAQLDQLGWITPPINFGAVPVTLVDYQPDERTQQIKQNTLAVSLGDYEDDEDEELGARGGGNRSALYPVFIDVYMQEQALSQAICDDIRDIYTDCSLHLIDQINNIPMPNLIEVEEVAGPTRPSGTSNDQFRRYWRVMQLNARLYWQT